MASPKAPAAKVWASEIEGGSSEQAGGSQRVVGAEGVVAGGTGEGLGDLGGGERAEADAVGEEGEGLAHGVESRGAGEDGELRRDAAGARRGRARSELEAGAGEGAEQDREIGVGGVDDLRALVVAAEDLPRALDVQAQHRHTARPAMLDPGDPEVGHARGLQAGRRAVAPRDGDEIAERDRRGRAGERAAAVVDVDVAAGGCRALIDLDGEDVGGEGQERLRLRGAVDGVGRGLVDVAGSAAISGKGEAFGSA